MVRATTVLITGYQEGRRREGKSKVSVKSQVYRANEISIVLDFALK